MKSATGNTATKGAAKTTTPAKRQKAALAPGKAITLQWDLHELPSSQHRAGLAGLALSVEFLKRNPDRKGVCEIVQMDERSLTLTVDREGMQSLFDDLFAATLEETRRESKWTGPEPKRIDEVRVKDEKTGKTKTKRWFIYDRVVPSGLLVSDWDAASPGSPKLWLKLWQDVVWEILRGVPKQREPYNARAEGRPIDDGGEVWDQLATKPKVSVKLLSTYALGLQEATAENVDFYDVARFRVLLLFWPASLSIYALTHLQRDGQSKPIGYALAVPDVAVLDDFVAAWGQVARSRSPSPAGYRPREAMLDLAAEAGLDVMRRASEVVASAQGATSTRPWLAAVDVFHMQKEGNNVRVRGLARIVPERVQVDEYSRIRRAGYQSPVFRRQRIANVLERRRWWSGFGRLCATTPEEMTFEHKYFRHDCRKALTEIEMKQDVAETDQTLEHLIFRRVRSYVLGKVERKYELSWSKAKGSPGAEKDYKEKREKVAREAFLAVRSRTGADFVTYFTSTLCSVPQHASEEAFLQLARAMMSPKDVEQIRSLTLLALSAVA